MRNAWAISSLSIPIVKKYSFCAEVMSVVAPNIPILIEFFAPWCGPCKAMEPVVAGIKEQLRDGATIFVINVEEHPILADEFTVLNLPTLIMYRNGKKIKTLTGIQKKEYLIALLLNSWF